MGRAAVAGETAGKSTALSTAEAQERPEWARLSWTLPRLDSRAAVNSGPRGGLCTGSSLEIASGSDLWHQEFQLNDSVTHGPQARPARFQC